MVQYQVYRVSGQHLLLDLQSDLIDTGSRVVAPLLPLGQGPQAIGRLEPILDIEASRTFYTPLNLLPCHRPY